MILFDRAFDAMLCEFVRPENVESKLDGGVSVPLRVSVGTRENERLRGAP
jgi:hypothetical protein